MDWGAHIGGFNRLTTEVYEDNYISDWEYSEVEKEVEGIKETSPILTPLNSVSDKIKARIVECKESNKYNITQDLAEAFEVFCEYKYKTNTRGEFEKTYTDKETGKVWTGRKVVFHNKGIKYDDAFVLDYENNLNSISVTSDATEIYSKLYIKPIESEHMTNGYITIADSDINPTGEDYILNFDYMLASGAINEYQYSKVKQYEAEMYKINQALREKSAAINDLVVDINNLEADLQTAENSIASLKESLVKFETLRDGSITNTIQEYAEAHPYAAIFIESTEGSYYNARLTAEGINASTIKGYTKSLEDPLFPNNKIGVEIVQQGVGADKNKVYIVLDEYGFASQINIPEDLFNSWKAEGQVGVSVIYLTFVYSPYNKYAAACEKINIQIAAQQVKRDNMVIQLEGYTDADGNVIIEGKKDILNKLENNKDEEADSVNLKTIGYYPLLELKEEKIMKFDRLMGAALQEGYWSPDTYDDAGEIVSVVVNKPDDDVVLIWDTEPLSNEVLPYYYSSINQNSGEAEKTYFKAIKLPEIIAPDDLVIKAVATNFVFEHENENDHSGYFYFIVDGKGYYTENSITSKQGQTWKLSYDNGGVTFSINGSAIPLTSIPPQDKNEIFNATSYFKGLSSFLTSRSLFPHAGFDYGYIEEDNDYKLVAVLNDPTIEYPTIEYDRYGIYQIEGNGTNLELISLSEDTSLVYPRIAINLPNVNSDSDTYQIKYGEGEEEEILEKFVDYSTIKRGTSTYSTLKITNNNADITKKNYTITFQVSHANDTLYLDAKQVAKDNSRPKVSYSISVANTPNRMRKIVLGEMVFINDYSVDVHRAPGYISGLTLNLDAPKEDEIVIANYKTKFEDLFSTITASSEAMKNNKRSYDLASSAFVGGQLSGSILQQALVNNNISLSFSQTNVDMTSGDGIILTNTSPYTNGVYGQVVLRGGGIFCSSDIDDAGNRIWNSAITPTGINANYITSGQLDTNQIRIFAGNDMSFQWNDQGIYAYRRLEDGGVDLGTYVRYSYDGLEYTQGDFTAVSLGWNGLKIAAQEGALTLTGNNGLTMYNGGGNVVLHLGRSGNNPNYLYGLTLYDGTSGEDIENANKTFYSTNEGNLWLKSYIGVGAEASVTQAAATNTYSGISGEETIVDGEEVNDIRIWAGAANHDGRGTAPFRVYEDGSFYATSGQIGSLAIDMMNYSLQIISSSGLSYTDGVTTSTTLTAQIYDNGVQVKPPPSWGNIKYKWYKLVLDQDGKTWKKEEIEGENSNTLNIQMTSNVQYSCEVYAIEGGESQ